MAKLFTEGLLRGEHYERLKRCICISILGFNLDEHPEYYRIYRLRDETGHKFSDMLEAKTKNVGIMEAVREVRDMGSGRTFRALHDARMKDIRDRNARDDYVRMEGIAEGHASGLAEGLASGLAEGEDKINRLILSLIQDGRQDDIKKVAKDKEYRDRLYKEYGI